MPLPISLSIVGLIIAIFCGIITYFIYQDNAKIFGWPTTTALIEKSDKELGPVKSVDWNGHDNTRLGWRPVISYSYKVNGKNYVSMGISSRSYEETTDSADSPPSQAFLSLLKRYPAGTKVTVHYNPNNPSNAWLEIDSKGIKLFGALASAGLLVSIVCLLLYFFRKRV